MVRLRRAVALLIFFASFSAIAATSPQSADPARDGNRDHPKAREQWFRQGRTILGEVAAGRLYEGYRQKMRMRAQQHRPQRSAQTSANNESLATSSMAPSSSGTAAAAISSSVIYWTPLGPAYPIYQFGDPDATNSPQRDYRLRYP